MLRVSSSAPLLGSVHHSQSFGVLQKACLSTWQHNLVLLPVALETAWLDLIHGSPPQLWRNQLNLICLGARKMGEVTCRLSEDVLATCFEFMQFRDIISVSHVSHFWQQSALACPSLWTHVTISRTSNHSAELMNTMISRSGQLPVNLKYLQSTGPVHKSFVDAVAVHMHRFRTLEWCHDPDLLELGRPAPLLRDLILRGDDVCTIPSDFLGGTPGSLRTLFIGPVRLPESCPALETLVHLRAAHPTRQDAHFDRLFQLCPRLQTLHLRRLPPGVRIEGRAPHTLQNVQLTSYEDCDLVELYHQWDLAVECAVQLRVELERAPAIASFFSGALELSVAYAAHRVGSECAESHFSAILPHGRRRTVICSDVAVESDRDEMLAGALTDDAALAQLHTLTAPLGVLVHAVPRWPSLVRLTIDIYEANEWRHDTSLKRYQWTQLHCLHAAETLTYLALSVRWDREERNPPTLRDAHGLLDHLALVQLSVPEVLVYGFPEDVTDELPARDTHYPRVVFMSTDLLH